jgi:hypothetical protein
LSRSRGSRRVICATVLLRPNSNNNICEVQNTNKSAIELQTDIFYLIAAHKSFVIDITSISPQSYKHWGTLLVAQLVQALRYKPEVRGFDSRWCHWKFSLTSSFRTHYDIGVDSASNRNEYQEYFLRSTADRCIGLTTLSRVMCRLS